MKKLEYCAPLIQLENLSKEDVITASTPTPVDEERENRYVNVFDMPDD